MGTSQQLRAGVFTQNKVEVVLRNALYPEDQDFVFYSAIPMITETKIDAFKNLFVVSYDRPMNPKYLSNLSELGFKMAADGSPVPIENIGVWSDDGRSISYKILETIDPEKYYTVDAFDPTSRVLSYRSQIPVTDSAPSSWMIGNITVQGSSAIVRISQPGTGTANVVLAAYNAKGVLLKCVPQTTLVDKNSYTFNAITGAAYYKAMIWNAGFIPLADVYKSN
jgi:hypothetical protein